MPDHKLEPGQLVLVRDADFEAWDLAHFSFFDEEDCYPFRVIVGGVGFKQCIPFNAETRHLQNTKQPYEPPKPPVEYEWGQKVEVCVGGNGVWRKGIFVKNKCCTSQPFIVAVQGYDDTMCVNANGIRPLPDDSAAH